MGSDNVIVKEKLTAYKMETITTKVSLAVWLIDDYTKKNPYDDVKVTINNGEKKPIKNLSGYYIFVNLPEGTYTVNVESESYFSEKLPIDTTGRDPKNPVIINLKPKPSYLFPSDATLLRGLVKNAVPVTGANVQVVGKQISNKTDEKGEFVLYFKEMEEENITIRIEKGDDVKTLDTIVKEMKTKSLGVISFP
jgi:hypothetical protein